MLLYYLMDDGVDYLDCRQIYLEIIDSHFLYWHENYRVEFKLLFIISRMERGRLSVPITNRTYKLYKNFHEEYK